MTSNTTAVNVDKSRYTMRRQGPNWGVLTLVAVVLHVVVLGGLWQAGVFDYALEIDREEAKRIADEAERRARERRERERQEREERRLREEDRDKLEEFEREQARQALLDYVKELQEIDDEMAELKDANLDGLEARSDDQYRQYLAEEILRLSYELTSDLTDYRDPDYQRFSHSVARDQMYDVLYRLVDSAQKVVEDIDDADRVQDIVKKADRTERSTQRMLDQAPPNRRDAEREANATGDEIQRLAHELAGLNQLNPEDYRDTEQARSEQDPALRPENLPELSPEELFDLARQLEEAINENFDHVRAAQLAGQMNMPLSQAMEGLTPSDLPQREMPEFPTDPQTFADLQDLQEALEQAANAAGQMAGSAAQQLANAQGMAGQGSGEGMGMMPGGGMLPGMGGGMGNNPFAMGMGLPGLPGRLDLRQNLDLTPPSNTPSQPGSNERDNTGNQKDGGQGMVQGTRLPDVDLTNRERFIHAQALPGHRFSRTSDRSGWVYLNTFYTIGPWDNEGRIDWDKRHGPDPQPFINVDLDAVYKDGKQSVRVPTGWAGQVTQAELDGVLRWRFVQTDTVRMTFPDEVEDGTYYAYSEVYFEEDMDMDVLIASDDATRAWIANSHPAYNNGFLFHTEDDKSSWELGEARKRLRFTKGLNRILIRLENGPQYARLSVLLSPVGAIDGGQ